MNIGLVLAGGSSCRMEQSNGLPKQFMEVLSKPLIAYGLDHLQQHPDIESIMVATQPKYFEHFKNIRIKYGYSKVQWVIASGAHRQATVYNALKSLEPVCSPEDIIVCISAVTPLLSRDVITKAIEAAAHYGAAMTVLPLTNTLLMTGDGVLAQDVPQRKNFRTITEPHVYQYGIIRKAYEQAFCDGFDPAAVTDCAQVLHQAGSAIAIIEGNADYFKITYPDDVKLFEAYLLSGCASSLIARDAVLEGQVPGNRFEVGGL